jgi:hypothetical protein
MCACTKAARDRRDDRRSHAPAAFLLEMLRRVGDDVVAAVSGVCGEDHASTCACVTLFHVDV